MRGHIQAWGKKPNTFKIWLELPPVKGARKRETLIVHGEKKHAEARMAERIAEIERGEFSHDGRMTVAQVAEKWLKARKGSGKVGAKMLTRYEGIVRDHINPHLGNVQLRKLTSDHIEYVLAQWREAIPVGRKAGTLKERTIHHNFATLKTMLAYAERKNLITRNPCASADAPSKGDAEISVLDEAGVDAVLNGLRDTVLAAPATFAVHTGMRRGEILGLKWEDVDLDRREASVRRSLEQLKGGESAFKPPKTTKSRRQVPLTAEAIRVLKAHRAEQNAIKLRLPGWNPEGLTFCDPSTGLRWGPDRFSSSFRYYVHKLGIPVTFHGFGRHGFATIALRAGVSVREVMEILGHTTRAMTDRYTSVLSDQQHEAVDRVGQRLAAARKRVAQ